MLALYTERLSSLGGLVESRPLDPSHPDGLRRSHLRGESCRYAWVRYEANT